MIYKIGMLCKHFKGSSLYEKNIYKILALNVDGAELDKDITYSGDGDCLLAKNLVVYENIFQNNKKFAREYEDISSKLSQEKKNLYNQEIKVQPLSEEEIAVVSSEDFIAAKYKYTNEKYQRTWLWRFVKIRGACMEEYKYHINFTRKYDSSIVTFGSEQLCRMLADSSNKRFREIFDNMDAFTIVYFEEEGVSFDTYATEKSPLKDDSKNKILKTRDELLDALYAKIILLENKANADKVYKLLKQKQNCAEPVSE